MTNTSFAFADRLARSVVAVPPLCRSHDLRIADDENIKIVRHLERGGITTLLYGGNANLYHVGLSDYSALLESLTRWASPNTWMIPSAGPDLGKLIDQARILREHAFPTAMALPLTFPATPSGVATGLRLFAETLGKPIVVYLKNDGYLTVEAVRKLFDDGLVSWVKYAIVRPDPNNDPVLRELCDAIDPTRIVSGMGERPAVVHVRDFGLRAFTSGSACVAPRGSAALLRAAQAGDFARADQLRSRYLPLEDLRDAHSPIRILHEAVSLAGLANTGPMLPLLSNIESHLHAPVAAAAKSLLATDAD